MDALVGLRPLQIESAILSALLAAAIVVWMAVAYRMRGAAKLFGVDTPRWVDLFNCAAPIAAAAAVGTHFLVFPAVLAATMGAIALGHGAQMDLARSPEETERGNWLDRIFGATGWWAEAQGLAMLGFLITAPAGIAAFIFGHRGAGAAFAFAGMAMPLCYELGHRSLLRLPALDIAPDPGGRGNVAAGELLFGAWLGVAIVCLLFWR